MASYKEVPPPGRKRGFLFRYSVVSMTRFNWEQSLLLIHVTFFLLGSYCSLKITLKNFLDPDIGAEPPELNTFVFFSVLVQLALGLFNSIRG